MTDKRIPSYSSTQDAITKLVEAIEEDRGRIIKLENRIDLNSIGKLWDGYMSLSSSTN